jgi:hypothetical protein
MLPFTYASPNTKFKRPENASKSHKASIFVDLEDGLHIFESHSKISFDFHCFLCLSNTR